MTFQGPERIGWDEPDSSAGQGRTQPESYVYGQPVADTERLHVSARGVNPLQAPWNLLISAGLYLLGVGYLTYLLITHVNDTPLRHDFYWEFFTLKVVALVAIVVLVGAMLLAQPWGRYGLSVVTVVGILVVVLPGFWPASLLGIAAGVALWLPRGHAWFGFR
ncbi:MAG: hypothetical protein GX859_01175 [Corynebacterium humireducens]|uniref:Uncharacterized protein n=1 Tax=Corynebacterium humireducens TaxID=1223514 RepID=A0A7X6SUL2_9CORY|nr:hypothetical protein [Corynebacterium humireducens]